MARLSDSTEAPAWEWGRRSDLRQSQEAERCWEDSGGGMRIRSRAHWPGFKSWLYRLPARRPWSSLSRPFLTCGMGVGKLRIVPHWVVEESLGWSVWHTWHGVRLCKCPSHALLLLRSQDTQEGYWMLMAGLQAWWQGHERFLGTELRN